MKEKEKEEKDDEFKEEIIIEKPIVLKTQPRKLNSKLIGKKKVLLRSAPPAPKQDHKKSNAEFLIDSIIKTYWATKWKEQLTIMKFSRTGFNRKRADFRSLCTKLNHSMKYHHYLNLAKLFDKMEQLPEKPGVKHDELYGKIKLVCKNVNRINGNNDKDKVKDEIIKENRNDNNIMNDFGNVEIKIDIPKVFEVEYKPEEDKKVVKKDENEIKIKNIESKIQIENESGPQLIVFNL